MTKSTSEKPNPLDSTDHSIFVLTPSNSRDHHGAIAFLKNHVERLTEPPAIESEFRFYELPTNAALFMCFPAKKGEFVLTQPVKMADVYRTEGRKNLHKLDESKLLDLCLLAIKDAVKKYPEPRVYRPSITGVDPKRETSALLKITDV